ncbi:MULTISPECIES: hypothetical protein [Pectobacterium]|uniref:Uncharacterized protein n=1 Tax=Pectobacterium carotovorum subsp. carotovorum (strain PC1) TaxID=561230 RepID=C6DC82_PECCP|nr:hypothetical protein [Pectobacterium carotovorum]ACT14176.1 hypothetical protein PC1_3153 [Pectobacterium carotovorum subsp. carotovorum PC1]
MDMSFFYINPKRVISNILLLLTLVVLSPYSIADDKKLDANDIHHPTTSFGKQSDVDVSNYFDDEKNLDKLAKKILSNKEKRDALEILEKVDSFYSKSFSYLLLLIIAMIGIVGVIIPLVIASYQARLLKKQTINLQESINVGIASKLSELKREIQIDNENEMLKLDRDVKKKIEEMEKENRIKMRKVRAESLAKVYHLGAITSISKKMYDEAALLYFRAGFNYIKYNNHYSLRLIINYLVTFVIGKIPPDCEGAELDKYYRKFIKELSLFNKESMYDDCIYDLKSSWNAFKKRVESGSN